MPSQPHRSRWYLLLPVLTLLALAAALPTLVTRCQSPAPEAPSGTYPIKDSLTTPGVLSSDWTQRCAGRIALTSAGASNPTPATPALAAYTGHAVASFGLHDQYAQAVLTAFDFSQSSGPAVRITPGCHGYAFLPMYKQIQRIDGPNHLTPIGDYAFFPGAGDILRLTAIGPDITLTDLTTHQSATVHDTTYPTGAPGIFVGTGTLKDFQADCAPSSCGLLPPPAFSLAAGTYGDTQSITLTAARGSTICYTLDGTTPSAAGGTCTAPALTYAHPLSLANPGATVTAIATRPGAPSSIVSTRIYKVVGVQVIANKPYFPFVVFPGSTREINVQVRFARDPRIHWSILHTTGGASAGFAFGNGPPVPELPNALPVVQVNIAGTPGACSIHGRLPAVQGDIANGRVVKAVIADRGEGFPPNAKITGAFNDGTQPSPPSATAEFSTDASGALTGGNIVSQGHDYHSAPDASAFIFDQSPYSIAATSTVTVQAQSVESPSSTDTFTFAVCRPPSTVMVEPFYQEAYRAQPRTLQSWVLNPDESGAWSIVSQPPGGDAHLADTTFRDAVFTATVTGRYTLRYTAHADSGQSATAIVYVSPNPMPAYPSTPDRTAPEDCFVDPALHGRVYDVGEGKQYPTLRAISAIGLLSPGSTIRVFNTDTTGQHPSQFNEYVQLKTSGTPTQPIRLCGVPDAAGNLPIVGVGQQSRAPQGVSSAAAAGFGVVSLWGGGFGAGTPFGYFQAGSAGPSYVSITGLHITNGRPGFTYISPEGAVTQYPTFAACLNIRSGSHIYVGGNHLDNCGNGITSAENANSGWANITQALTVRGNHVEHYGNPELSGEHGLYLQTFYALIEGNLVDNDVPRAGNSGIKWRGVEGIFRYNRVGPGPLRILDLVDNQDAAAYVSFEDQLFTHGPHQPIFRNAVVYSPQDGIPLTMLAAFQESMQKDFVYGNLLTGFPAINQIHYSEDHDAGMAGRSGLLSFYSNTLDNARQAFDTATSGGYTMFFNPRIYAANNIFFTTEPTFSLNRVEAILGQWQSNLFRTGTMSIAIPILGGNIGAGTAHGWTAECDYTCLWPLTSPLDPHQVTALNTPGVRHPDFLLTPAAPYDPRTFLPTPGSAALNAVTPLQGPAALLPVRFQYDPGTSSLLPRSHPTTLGGRDESK